METLDVFHFCVYLLVGSWQNNGGKEGWNTKLKGKEWATDTMKNKDWGVEWFGF